MTQKDKNLFVELGLTFLLLITAVFLLKPTVFWQYQLLLIGGSIVGFSFGWCNRKGVFEGIKYITDAAILITIIWIGYRISKTNFLYKEVIAIFIQGVIILEIIISFNFSAPGKIVYIRLLSFIVFMASPVFAVAYSIPLAIVYLLAWLAVLRFQFAVFLQPIQEKGSQRYYSLATSLVCFLIAMFLAWFISSNVYLGRIDKGMFLLDEDLQDMGLDGGKNSNQANKFYSLQDDFLNKITGLALKLGSYKDRRQFIYLASELVKETIETMEVDKAEMGLIDILRRQGPGLEGNIQGMTFLKEYIDKNNALNLLKNKEDIMDILGKHPVGIINKIKIISLANKITQASSYEQLQENSRALQTTIQNSSLAKGVQKDLSALARRLSNLAAFERYHYKVRYLDQRSQSFGKEIEKIIADAISDIKHAQDLDDFKQTAKKIRQLKNDPRILEQKSGRDILKSLEEVSRIKLDLFLAKKSEQVIGYASQKQDLGSQEEEFDKKMDEIGKAKNQQNKDDNFVLGDGLGQMLDLKTESFKQSEKEGLKEIKVTPKLLEISLGEEGKLSATGVYDDGSSSDLTILGNWGTLNKSIATALSGDVASASVGETSVYVEFKGVRSEYAKVVVGGPRLTSLLLTPQSLKIPRDGKANFKVQGNYYDHSERDLTAQVSWGIEEGPGVVKIENGVVCPLRFGQSKIYAEYSRLKSNTASIDVILTLGWLLWLLAKIISILLLCIISVTFMLYLLAENKRRQLRSLKDNPREFILGLHENAIRLVTIFGLRYDVYTFPLFFAELAKEKFLVENNVFLDFSIKFEEAKYSRHVLQNSDLAVALNDYNNFFNGICKNQSQMLSFYRYCLALLHCRPIFILSVLEASGENK
jgi:hypothetical protein